MSKDSKAQKRKPQTEAVADEHDLVKITPLGAGNEVGRSCIVLQYKGKNIMLDCGLHPAHSGLAALPFFDTIDPASVDILLVTHFHLDHAAALPYFVERTTFKGRIFMTHPTKAIFKWLLADYVKVSNVATEEMLYTEQDLLNCFAKIEVIDYHQEIEVDGVRFTGYNAGHVLGAAMFLIEIAGVKVFYTGDYSREEDRHLMAAERPPKNIVPEVLITESTYGVASHQPRAEREALFTSLVHKVVSRGGRCLIPVFALGRAQELLLILDEYWQAHPELHNIPIHYASSLAKKCMTVYQTYANMMNERIRKQIKTNNPFQFKHISNLKSVSQFDDIGPCVMMASPGMLQSGLSRELFEIWCVDKKNGVIIPGYVVEGTLAKDILSQPQEISSLNGGKLALRLSVEYISFSAHVDFQQNAEFIDEMGSKHLILVHGEATEMGRLKSALNSKYADTEDPMKIYTPRNCETVEIFFKSDKVAKILGNLATESPAVGNELSGVLLVRDFKYNLIAANELEDYTPDLMSATFEQRQYIPCRAPFSVVKWLIECMFGNVQVLEKEGLLIFDTIRVIRDSTTNLILVEWEGNHVNDMIADSIVGIIIQAESSPASVKATKSSHSHAHGKHDVKEEPIEIQIAQDNSGSSNKEIYLVHQFLAAHFADEVSRVQGTGTLEPLPKDFDYEKDLEKNASLILAEYSKLAYAFLVKDAEENGLALLVCDRGIDHIWSNSSGVKLKNKISNIMKSVRGSLGRSLIL